MRTRFMRRLLNRDKLSETISSSELTLNRVFILSILHVIMANFHNLCRELIIYKQNYSAILSVFGEKFIIFFLFL